jgi:hypothetical protein
LVNQVVREGMGPRRPAGSADEYGVPIAEDMNVWVYVNARHPVGHPDHLQIFADLDAANA